MDEGEMEGNEHPGLDGDLLGLDSDEQDGDKKNQHDRRGPPRFARSHGDGTGQYREPFEYGMILKALGLKLDDHEIAVRYYRERAQPHLIPFPVREMPRTSDPLPEGYTTWEIGMPLEEADWLQSVLVSPAVVPGLTTVQQVWGTSPGHEPEKQPIDLDLYVDCSGSMPNPQQATSYLTLAGAIVAMSALRVGARVQATLWSGAGQFETTRGFVRDINKVLRILTGYLGGGTAFPVHVLRDTYEQRKPTDRAVHVMVISDDGVTTMFDKDERGHSGKTIAADAMKKARGGGTLVLNVAADWREIEQYKKIRTAEKMGWQVHAVQNWEDLVAFARAFSRANYGQEKRKQDGR